MTKRTIAICKAHEVGAEPCAGRYTVDGKLHDQCGEPCSFVMDGPSDLALAVFAAIDLLRMDGHTVEAQKLERLFAEENGRA